MKHMKTLTAAALLLGSGLSTAVELSIAPPSSSLQQGDSVSVDLIASGLGNFASDSLGAFFTEILFDDTILDFLSASYGPFLGDPADPIETSILTTAGVGSVGLDEFSFLLDFELDALQPDTFTLATLTFSGQALGTSALSFGTVDLSDAVGNTLVPTALNTGSIQVTAAPIPATAALMLPFAFLLARRFRRR
jgi:hypothetical protein